MRISRRKKTEYEDSLVMSKKDYQKALEIINKDRTGTDIVNEIKTVTFHAGDSDVTYTRVQITLRVVRSPR